MSKSTENGQPQLFEMQSDPERRLQEYITRLEGSPERTPSSTAPAAEDLEARADRLQDAAGFTVETARRETEDFSTISEEQRTRDAAARAHQGPRWGRSMDGSIDRRTLSPAGKRAADQASETESLAGMIRAGYSREEAVAMLRRARKPRL